jgi:hypothetical protein
MLTIASQLSTLGLQTERSTARIPHPSTSQTSRVAYYPVHQQMQGSERQESLASLKLLEQNTSRSLGYWPDTYLKTHGHSSDTIDYIYTIYTAGHTVDSAIELLEVRGMAVAEIVWLWSLIRSCNHVDAINH